MKPAAFAIAVFAVALLAGCQSTSSGSKSGGDGGSNGTSGASGSCPSVPGAPYFSDPILTTVPAKGAPYGDGSELLWKGPEELIATYEVFYLDAKNTVVDSGNGVFDQTKPKGEFSTKLKVFDSDAKDRPGFIEVHTVYNAAITIKDGEAHATGDDVTLGRYCVSIKTD